MQKNRIRCIFIAATLVAGMASAAVPISGPFTGTISQVNADEDGITNGFVVTGYTPITGMTTTALLKFPKLCNTTIGSLALVGDSVTFSGKVRTDPDGISTVSVTAFVDNVVYVPALPAFIPAAETESSYISTAGTTTGVFNYDSEGEINGFFFDSTANTAGPTGVVLVLVGSETYEALVKAGTVVTMVTGTLETNSCNEASAVEASLLNGTIKVKNKGNRD